MKSNNRKSFINVDAKNFRLVSLDVVTYADEYMVYAATIGFDRIGDLNYDEYIMIIFKEGDKIVYAEQYKAYAALQLAEEKYDYSSPVEGYSLLDGNNNDNEENQNTNDIIDTNGSSEQMQSDNVRNEVPERYEQTIKEFKYQSEGFIKLNALNIKVGEFATPMAASV